MAEESKKEEVNESPEGQEAPEAEATKEERKILTFDHTASIKEEGGEISNILEQLYAACEKDNIPLVVGIAYVVTDEGDSYGVGTRTMQVTGEDHFMPDNLLAMLKVLNNEGLAYLVVNTAQDGLKRRMIELMSRLSDG